MRLVKVIWVDSVGVGSDWAEVGDGLDLKHECVSVGFLARDGEHSKVIVPHISPENKAIGTELRGCGDMMIPTVAIVSMVDLIQEPEA